MTHKKPYRRPTRRDLERIDSLRARVLLFSPRSQEAAGILDNIRPELYSKAYALNGDGFLTDPYIVGDGSARRLKVVMRKGRATEAVASVDTDKLDRQTAWDLLTAIWNCLDRYINTKKD